ncbi:KpsF/GutQ family sugar-phosphate isomerase [Halobacillus litoralis]|uniref:KpsF/GutQ family sugar-phosphate isomerase n=1 Tax=Halobacillus litoralis TaxID=45668 RepID=A0A845DRG8_9BACI|nr:MULTISPECIES: KpsF/GutQ family sugar-phosphate isomerase [Halobacillus]MYL20123.1 KpsF/GutQ family sugar-phosphate isomerase [Halobacillus litoralis]MYL30757.1 KpsF/GutQ family sugar-phosphate isomerase [Halobacillus halophilus]MYL36439.1 KpsF/GutQ family sugar-phosphate isomerase [Halobacillus litoralis]
MLDLQTEVDYRSIVEEVLDVEAGAITSLKEHLDENIDKAIEMILSTKNRTIITGMGKSGLIGKKIAATLASTGTPAIYMHPSEGLHGDLGMVTSEDTVIALSNSGETEEVLNLLPSLQKIGTNLICIVKNPMSTLAIKSDVVLTLGRFEEACPLRLAPTTSTTVTLALGDAIAVALLKKRNFQPEDFALFHPSGSLGRRLLMTIDNLLAASKKSPMVTESCTVKDALFEMTKHGLGATCIVGEDGTLQGILTDGDIRRAMASGEDVMDQTVKELGNTMPITTQADVLATNVLEIMEEKRINVMPVIDENNKPLGMIHFHDMMNLGI